MGVSFEMRQLFFQQVTEHQTGSELARMLQAFCALGVIFGRFCIDVFINLSRKEWLEIVLFIKVKNLWLILSINDGKATSGLVIFFREPFLDETENVGADTFATETFSNSQSTNKHAWITREHFFPVREIPHGIATAAWQVVNAYTVIRYGKACNNSLHIVF